eukprot:scaffold34395_cov31-Tisochrysis_lutea.AAC.4
MRGGVRAALCFQSCGFWPPSSSNRRCAVGLRALQWFGRFCRRSPRSPSSPAVSADGSGSAGWRQARSPHAGRSQRAAVGSGCVR